MQVHVYEDLYAPAFKLHHLSLLFFLTHNSVYLLYKNSLTAVSESRPRIYAVSPPLLETAGAQNVTMALSVDMTKVDFSRPYNLEVAIGTFPCTDPSIHRNDSAAAATTTSMASATIGPQGGIVAGPDTQLVPFPAAILPKTAHQPFVLTCVSTPGVGTHLLAQVTISQAGTDVPLLMPDAASYAPPVVLSITATGSAANGDFDIQVSGKHFGAIDLQPMVLVKDTPCTVTVWESDTSVVCKVS